jgi:hypothetical protein
MTEQARLENEGNISSMSLPAGFAKGRVEREDNYVEFPSTSPAAAKLCYWSRPFFASPPDVARIREILSQAPHELSGDEVLDMIPCMAPGRWAYNGNFTQVSYRTEEIDGRRVLAAELKFNDQDKRSYVVFANPSFERGTIDVIWFEATTKAFDEHKKAAIGALQSIKWQAAEEALC